jgi:hypothetical protein
LGGRCASGARRWVGGQGASDDGFAVRVNTAVKGAGNKTVRTGLASFGKAVVEGGDVANPGGAAVVPEGQAALGRRLRQRRLRIEAIARCQPQFTPQN